MPDTAPRIAPLPPEEWTDEARAVFAYWEGEEGRANGSRLNTMLTFGRHPALALATLDLGRYFMLQSGLSARQVKLVVMRVAHRYQATYQWTHNVLGARQIGISDAEIAAIQVGPADPAWSRADRALLQAVDEVNHGGQIRDATWTELTALFDERLIMDLVHAAGYFAMVAWGQVAMGVALEPDVAAVSRNRARDT
ncbi:carboxymuconolactone decarboxylase family protein [Novosphingobium aerophilum]|uniref:Carboxymuconolactone decarboxylase family protein n=1 Tax=Novosphingobium aerophilum TaxID=2839843 RepID=A0A7X1F4Y6_9SPHN|nr:carboxymuconolactone decarboxylase family protein [Novosphingobium aerophilum]MBC2650470.1 carboxymuconolactone decarboxylase family protein [Novosphingobium aerophilum]